MAIEPSCRFCDKHGLLIMPVRYAIAPDDLGLPPVAVPLKVEDTSHSVGKGKPKDLTLHGSAHYTTRLLRSGYLYVYDEKRDHLTGYWISQDGYFMAFPPETTISESAKTATPCDFAGHKELSGCIAIDDAENAGLVWLGFSDVQWTPAVINAHRGPAGKTQRELHMRAFNAGAWAAAHKTAPGQPASTGRGSTPHAVTITALAKTVADYAPIAKTAHRQSPPFTPPTAPSFHSRTGQAEGLLSACRRRSPRLQAAIVALDDPSGAAQDLAALMQWHQNRLLDTPIAQGTYGKGYATTYRNLVALRGSVETLQAASNEKVKMQIFTDKDDVADSLEKQYLDTPAIPGMVTKQVALEQSIVDAIRNPTPQAIEREQNDAWNDYLKRTVIGQPNSAFSHWQQDFKSATDAVQTQHIKPLSQAYAAWMQSNLLANKLECTHDGANPHSGEVYAETLQRCMSATQQIEACQAIFVGWLKGDITDKTNLLLRALALRLDTLIQAFATTSLDPLSIPWQTLRDQYTSNLKDLLKPDPVLQISATLLMQEAQKKEHRAKLAAEMTHGPDTRTAAQRAYAQVLARNQQTKTQADQAKRDAGEKLLPDAVASLLAQITGPLTTLLREYNGKVAEKTLARWMAIVGVTLHTPVGIIEVNGTVKQTIEYLSKTFVDNLADAAVRSGKPMSASTIRQLTTYAQRQVKGSFATGNIGEFETRILTRKTSKMAVFITSQMASELDAIRDPTEKVRYLVAKVKTPQTLHQYGVLRMPSRLPLYGAMAEGALTVVDAIFKAVAYDQTLQDEASILPFQKVWTQDVRHTLGQTLYLGAMGTGAVNVVKMMGAWRSIYATGMAERLAGKQLETGTDIALRGAGVLTASLAGVMAAMDIVDGLDSRKQHQWTLFRLQILSGSLGIAAAGFGIWAAFAADGGATMVSVLGGMTLTGIGFVLAVVVAALALLINHIKGDNIAQWLERCYWGTLPEDARYPDAKQEELNFSAVLKGA